MSTRKELHRLIDELPEERLPEVGHFIRELHAEADQRSLGREALAAIEQGWDNFKASKTIRLDDLKEEPGL